VREVASKTSDIAGDGTTTATVLAQAIVREGAKAVAAGMNPMDLKRGIDRAVNAVVDELKKRTRRLTTPAETAQVGAIAANGEAEIGKMISAGLWPFLGSMRSPEQDTINGSIIKCCTVNVGCEVCSLTRMVRIFTSAIYGIGNRLLH